MFIRLRRVADNDIVIINAADVVRIRSAERGTACVFIRGDVSQHVLESVDDVGRLLGIDDALAKRVSKVEQWIERFEDHQQEMNG